MPKDLEHLDERECGERNQDRLEPVERRERLRFDEAMQERRVDRRDLEGHRREHGEDQLRVREQADLPNRLTRRSHREDEEELEEYDRREGDRPSSSGVRSVEKFEEEDSERTDRQDCRDDDDEEEDVPREHALLRVPRRSIHDVRRIRVHPKREGRKAVRHEVDPEELDRGEEREEPRVKNRERRDEHDEDLPAFAESRKATNFRMFS